MGEVTVHVDRIHSESRVKLRIIAPRTIAIMRTELDESAENHRTSKDDQR